MFKVKPSLQALLSCLLSVSLLLGTSPVFAFVIKSHRPELGYFFVSLAENEPAESSESDSLPTRVEGETSLNESKINIQNCDVYDQCEDLGDYSLNAIGMVAEKGHANIVGFFAMGFAGFFTLGAAPLVALILDREADTNIIGPAQRGKAALYVLGALEQDITLKYESDFKNLKKEAMANALKDARKIDEDPTFRSTYLQEEDEGGKPTLRERQKKARENRK